MKLTVRIYKRHDLDLLFLHQQQSDVDFKESLKKALKAYVNGKRITNSIPQGKCKSVSSMPSVVQMHIMLDPKDDRDILAWTQKITRGRRNNIIKNIYRNTFPPIINPYLKDSENNTF